MYNIHLKLTGNFSFVKKIREKSFFRSLQFRSYCNFENGLKIFVLKYFSTYFD